MKHKAKGGRRKGKRADGRPAGFPSSFLLPTSAFLLCCTLAAAASAQQYPSRPVRVIVAQSAGSSIDTTARIVPGKLSEVAGQQFVIDTRGGAAGTIRLEIGARAARFGVRVCELERRLRTTGYTAQGLVPLGSPTPEDFGNFVKSDYARIAKLVKVAGIKPE